MAIAERTQPMKDHQPGQPPRRIAGVTARIDGPAGTSAAINPPQVEAVLWQHDAAAAIVELCSRTCQQPQVSSATLALVNLTAEFLSAKRVAVGLMQSGCCRLQSVSGLAEADLASDIARQWEAALHECTQRSALTTWPPRGDQDRHLTLAHRAVAGESLLVTAPLKREDGRLIGAWGATLDAQDTAGWDRASRFLSAAGEPMAAALDVLQRAEPPTWLRPLRYLTHAAQAPLRKRLAFGVIALGLLGAIPMRYQVKADCQLEPVVRRYVAAPYDGVLEQSFVSPGDLVAAGQKLGRISGREIKWELAGIAAELAKAGKQRDLDLASSTVAAAQIDALEVEKLENRQRLLAHRLSNLDIKSPIGGLVIAGDLERSEGAPLKVGQSLYEVAPLDQLLAEIAISPQELSHVCLGQSVSLRFDASPAAVTGTLSRIHPRCEVRDGQNVVIGEVTIDNRQASLRPGMKGQSRIATDTHSAAWIVLHQPWNATRRWLGW